MPAPKFNPRNAVLLSIIILVAALRLASFSGIGPLTVFTPVGAMALFGGAYFNGNIKPFLFPLLTLFISDVLISFMIFPDLRTGLLYSGWMWTYAAFALITVAGKFLIKKVSVKNVFIAVLVATFVHWVVSDIGMCVESNRFSAALYITKLASAVPYELRFMAGTGFYGLIMFGAFELLQKKYQFPGFSLRHS